MNIFLQAAYDEKISSLADTYIKEGFEVIAKPDQTQLPFYLGGYVPNLVATRGDTGLIFHVGYKSSGVSAEQIQSAAEEITKHPGWRFMSVSLGDVDQSIPTTAEELPTWHELKEKVELARNILAQGAEKACLFYLWVIFEGALRRRALPQIIPLAQLQTDALVDHMYSKGEISIKDFDLIQKFMAKSNRIAHGATQPVDAPMLTLVIEKVGALLDEWSRE
jgi:hypothetical protein